MLNLITWKLLSILFISYTGIKPYSCSICDKNFTQMSSLARHKQMIHGIPKEVAQQYYNPSLIGDKSRIDISKENKVTNCLEFQLIFHQFYNTNNIMTDSVLRK